eukprot:scaffold5874_cov125-Chaetoceros_neogracile.AAC.2
MYVRLCDRAEGGLAPWAPHAIAWLNIYQLPGFCSFNPDIRTIFGRYYLGVVLWWGAIKYRPEYRNGERRVSPISISSDN